MGSVAASDRAGELYRLLVTEGLTLREAGRILGISRTHVGRLACRCGITKRRRHLAKYFRREIYRLRLDGVPAKEIAEQIGCGVRTVYAVARDYERSAVNKSLGVATDQPFTRQQWGASAEYSSDQPLPVMPWRCPRHGLVTFRPCVACMAEDARGNA